jgi:hypothetical protein
MGKEENMEQLFNQIMGLYYSDFIENALTYYHFFKFFLKVIKSLGREDGKGEEDDSDEEEFDDIGMSSDSDY